MPDRFTLKYSAKFKQGKKGASVSIVTKGRDVVIDFSPEHLKEVADVLLAETKSAILDIKRPPKPETLRRRPRKTDKLFFASSKLVAGLKKALTPDGWAITHPDDRFSTETSSKIPHPAKKILLEEMRVEKLAERVGLALSEELLDDWRDTGRVGQ